MPQSKITHYYPKRKSTAAAITEQLTPPSSRSSSQDKKRGREELTRVMTIYQDDDGIEENERTETPTLVEQVLPNTKKSRPTSATNDEVSNLIPLFTSMTI